jgi:hypothetical protein
MQDTPKVEIIFAFHRGPTSRALRPILTANSLFAHMTGR